MIIIVDFGSQTAHLIGRRLRQLGVKTEFVNPSDALSTIQKLKPSGIILSGGPSSVYEKGAPTIPVKLFQLGIPVLGICYGWQLMAKLLGGSVKNTAKEYGPATLKIVKKASIFTIPQTTSTVIMSHGDTVMKLPKGFVVFGSTAEVKNAAAADVKKQLFGIHFHPEAHHTKHGQLMLQHFAQDVCKETLNPLKLDPKTMIAAVKEQVGDGKVICAVSGGVDSTVAAYLICKAIGKNCIPVYVDSGLMRPHTEERVRLIFTKLVKSNLIVVHERKRFLAALKGVTDPELKRKAIGKLYIDLFQEIAVKQKDAKFLGQGTIYSDVIESKGSRHASHIKSHHNVGGLPKDMKMSLVEPMRQFYKDEVREIGKLAGLPADVLAEHPFPGPGYAVRVRGEVTEARLAQVIQADTIVVEEVKKAKLYDSVFQCFAVMSGAMSTAVKGDSRAFAEVVAIRAYESIDVMTSQWAHFPHELLQSMASRIVNEVPNVSRVVYDITNKPPATMEWE